VRQNLNRERASSTWYVYNPPFFLLSFLPFTFLHVPAAYTAGLYINGAALVVLAGMIGHILGWRLVPTALLFAALLGSRPLYMVFHNGQPTIFMAIFLTGSFLALEHKRTWLSAALVTLTGLKPQWLLVPSLALIRRQPAMLRPLIVSGLAILAAPFILVSWSGVLDISTSW
jgi:hypothetical protein